MMNKHERIFKIVWLSVLSALILVFQLLLGSVKLGPVSISFVMVPILVGGLVVGPYAGLFLGFLAGIVNILNGLFGVDSFTLFLLQEAPFWTIVICCIKSALGGYVPALLYHSVFKNKKVGCVIAAILAPIINTGIFVIGTYLFLSEPVITFIGGNQDIWYLLLIVISGYNFLAELAFNIICTPAVMQIVKVIGIEHPNNED